MGWWIRLAGVLAVACVVGCSGDGRPTCRMESDCPSGICLYDDAGDESGHCPKPCDSEEQCQDGFVCGVGADGAGLCVPGCDPAEPLVLFGYQCVDGVPTACEHVSEAEQRCEACGCADDAFCCRGEGCDTAGVCEPKRDVGEPCPHGGWCRTDECSPLTEGGDKVCVLPPGEECTTDMCPSCDPAGDGTNVCTRDCSTHDTCEDDERCIQFEGEAGGFCRAVCGVLAGGRDCMDGYTCTDITSLPENVCAPDRLD